METIERVLIVNSSIEKVWDFFTNHKNLEKLNPPEIRFRVVNSVFDDKIFDGNIITYKFQVMFFTFTWVSKISAVKEYMYFIDKMIKGPFKRWYHFHHFEKLDNNKTCIKDKILYEPPFYPVSFFTNGFVRNKLEYIFQYRDKVLQKELNQ
ncbi:SRPBCC family protein [Deferribacter autotrophicus]|uniref:SRPBCC family protein n=1 Tax=Deferribacter autotrophicus TaxID=500465 RepID=A0A5A8F092_9BACT|nr:SRPBCC family protein [Deferribacter autotrophicus]KAA0257396.1 SRPBCC family protein [Deferribacter autotrophicus]